MNKKQLKKEFIRFLKVNRVYTRFVKNLLTKERYKSLNEYLDIVIDHNTKLIPYLVSSGFTWPDPLFWNEIDTKWRRLYNKLNK
jgi:hypothetical protein